MSTPPPSPWSAPQPQQPPQPGQVPYPQAYQQPWGAPPPGFPPPGFPPPAPSYNGFAIASIPVGLLCLAPVGVILAVVALVQIPRRQQRGKALAVVGLVLSLLMSVVSVFVVDKAADSFMEGWRRGVERREAEGRGGAGAGGTAEGRRTGVNQLAVGQCYNVPGGDLERYTRFVFTVPCTDPHDAEVTRVRMGLNKGPYPGMDGIERMVIKGCWKAQDEYAPDSWAVPAEVQMFFLAPDKQAWESGDRDVTCLMAVPHTKRSGSLRQQNLTTDQRAYLTQADNVELALSGAPDAEEVVADLDGYKLWAHEIETAMTAESTVLRSLAGRPGLQRPADALRGELDKARGLWKVASEAKDAKAFEAASGAAVGAMHIETEKAVRAALGLATTVPEWREDFGAPEGGGSGGGPGGPGGSGGPGGRGPSHQAV
ncbi:DUF4190 domain-containing protein [Streptomyces sp. WAC06614]|uniref:DUF4190 domain-containing protein n=1 Tax=Streptomyces sp. WAC06614 TaxID=2487416 RepID=UPI000F77D930|nr:DUF4190 domain-containing protein [Streptomyces sp. WAC06614]RSS60444.1 DUF4190 domain-containing protein [Streptomyces sp. WAC06614]